MRAITLSDIEKKCPAAEGMVKKHYELFLDFVDELKKLANDNLITRNEAVVIAGLMLSSCSSSLSFDLTNGKKFLKDLYKVSLQGLESLEEFNKPNTKEKTH